MPDLTILSNEIRIRDGLYSLNDLHKASGGKPTHRPNQFLRTAQTKELVNEINRCADLRIGQISRTENVAEIERGKNSYLDKSADLQTAYKAIKGGHKNQGTWVCKQLVYAYAMWISPQFMLQVINAFDAMHNNPTEHLPSTSFKQTEALLKNAITAANKAYQQELVRQAELLELNNLVSQLERDARVARHKLEMALHSHGRQQDNLAHIDTMHSMIRLQ